MTSESSAGSPTRKETASSSGSPSHPNNAARRSSEFRRTPSHTKHRPPESALIRNMAARKKLGSVHPSPVFRRIFVRALRRMLRGPRRPGCLLAFSGSLFRSGEEKKLAHLAHRIAGDGALARPRECLFYIGAFQYPKSAHVLLGLGVRSVGDKNGAIGMGG